MTDKKIQTGRSRQSASAKLPVRFVVCHMHPVSARLRFLKHGGSICLPSPLPKLSELMEPGQGPAESQITVHPAHFLNTHCAALQMPAHRLQIETGFRLWVDTPALAIPVYLIKVDGPQPFDSPPGCEWIELPDSFSLLPIERLILRHIYEWLLC